jgi:hypothetical protein
MYSFFLFFCLITFVPTSCTSSAPQSCTQWNYIYSYHIVLLRRRCRSDFADRRKLSDSVLNFLSSAVNSTPPPPSPLPCRPVKAKNGLLTRLLILRPRLISRGEGSWSSRIKPLRGGEEEKTPLPPPILPPPPFPLLLGLRLVVPAVGEGPRGGVMGVK